MDRRTDDGRKVITIAHPEHSSGELIKTILVILYNKADQNPLTGYNVQSLTIIHPLVLEKI